MDSTLQPVLILNTSYEPIAIEAARRALKLIAKEAAWVEESYDSFVHKELLLPSVIRLRHYRHIPRHKRQVSRKNILLRDRHTCQYCGVQLPASRLTLDHVVPRSADGLTTWENLVACCQACNNRKADRTPEQAGMTLLSRPQPLTVHTHRSLLRSAGVNLPSWRKYLWY